ncbi:97 kDa heat shock protein-like isoform X2 [Lingula anatina]|uniref:97 kDa heat shock protein-like isoform X1 n=1 Tax=Lingula anatina TaxID=7574 RepID=A0A1S3K7I3_LINAN|nr:97 kDa heat shock protein-like isoform X1 [Lingula anatina]XP_013418590.1 97 kDa heat shock protein-like isoform X2 [Lingula anatina]|eukprot:XP_013418589.1 97 kDa heat shock protein-like isoform X1 [Lingula anatina]
MACVGFDFGTSSCYVAVARQGGIETIANDYSERRTPSVVALGEKQRFLGVGAKNQEATNVKNTVSEFKRLIGRKFKDPMVQREIKHYPNEIVEGVNGSVGIKARYLGEQHVFTAEQLGGMMLTKLKQTAEHGMGTKVVDCVISVPSFYTDAERRAMIDVAKMADLNCLRIMNDTTAAALAYGIYKQDLPEEEAKPRNVVIIDMGYSSLQISVCAFNKGKLKVLATACDAFLGGRDLDRLLVDHFAAEFKEKYKIDVKSNVRAMVRLKTACERLKKLMSSNTEELPMNIECIMDDKDVSGRMKRAKLEELAAPLVARIETVMRQALQLSGLKTSDLYSVEIIGGSSRVPIVKETVKKVYGLEASTTLNADEAVSRGCALQCAILSPTFRVRDFSVTDAQPYPIKLVWQGVMEDESEINEMEVFPMFHAIPFTKMLTFYRRDAFTLEAQYGASTALPYPTDTLGSFTIKDVKAQPKGESAKVKVKVRVDIHGIFKITSATTTEKIENASQEEPMEVDEKVETVQNGPKEGESSPAGGEAKPTENAEETPMQTDQPSEGQVKEDEEKKEEKDEKKDDKKEAKKNKVKVKTIDLSVDSNVPGLDKNTLNLMIEEEAKMIMSDKLEKERADAKNSVEEYVYEMRDKISGPLEEFLTEKDREQFSKILTETEDWLYEDGEDCKKSVYIDKLAELKKLGDPPGKRFREFNERPQAFEQLGGALQLIRKALDQYNAKDEKYEHIEASEMKKVEKCLKEKQDWFDKQFNLSSQLPKHKDPAVLASQINSEKEALHRLCFPILNKPKPKPKEEPPKDDKKDEKTADAAAGEQTVAGEGDGQKSGEQNEQQPPSEASTAEMELD